MASPFTMLGMLSKARRSAARRLTMYSPPIETDTPTASSKADTSDTISLSKKSSQTPSLLSLSLKPSIASSIAQTITAAAAAPSSKSNGFSSSSKVINPTTDDVQSILSTAAGISLSEEPESTLSEKELTGRTPSDGSSLVHNEEPEPEQVSQQSSSGIGEGDWTEIATPLSSASPSVPTAAQEKRSISLNDSNSEEAIHVPIGTTELVSVVETEAEKKERELVKVIEAHEADKKRLEDEIEGLVLEKYRLSEEAAMKERTLAKVLEEKQQFEYEVRALEKEKGRLSEEAATKERNLVEALEAHEAEMARLSDKIHAATAETVRLAQETKQLKDNWVKDRAQMGRERSEEKEQLQREKEMLRSRLVILEAGIEGGEQTRKRLEAETDVLRREKEETSKDVTVLQRRLTSSQNEVVEARDLAVAAQKKMAALEDVLRSLREERNASLASRDAQVQSLDTAVQEAKKELVEARLMADEDSRKAKVVVRRLKTEVAECRQQENNCRDQVYADQLKRQASDIRFTHPKEMCSQYNGSIEPVDAAVNILCALNSEIFQTAASFADSVEVNTKAVGGLMLEDLDPLIAKISPMLSRELIFSLRSAYTEPLDVPNPLLLQVALQACVAYCCNRFVTSWYPLHWDYGTFLQILHGRIVETGKTQLAESWRATTKALLRLTSESHPQFTTYLREHFVDILAIIGRSDTQDLMNRFEEKLSVIARLAIRMHILFNDTPSSLETFIAQPGSTFFSKLMEDTYADDDDDDSDSTDLFNSTLKKVVCTSDIGLQRLSAKGGADNIVVVRPKVVLAAILSHEW